LLGINIAYLIGGTVVIERVFALNGLGNLMLDAIDNRDFPVVQGVTLIYALRVIIVILLSDLATARIDPRIRSSERGGDIGGKSRAPPPVRPPWIVLCRPVNIGLR